MSYYTKLLIMWALVILQIVIVTELYLSFRYSLWEAIPLIFVAQIVVGAGFSLMKRAWEIL